MIEARVKFECNATCPKCGHEQDLIKSPENKSGVLTRHLMSVAIDTVPMGISIKCAACNETMLVGGFVRQLAV
ncbi:hypothetical protein [Vibrio barjaei]|uniref:hypothetical protein n=1 Tax=Vibrio barjaei TaxID=1676683 RepID=UPI002283B034|nr:hypothetical protein [Vibrio barjaei]MCY9873868.1 hypothetical protein [Vibrio barjaei]